MLLAIMLILVGFIILTISAEYTVIGSVAIANKLKIPTLIIGLTIVAFGTSAPEFVVSIKAALNGASGISLGNIVGSNISNIALILGLAAMIHPVISKKSFFYPDYIILLLSTALFSVFCLFGKIVMWQGLFLVILMIAFIYFNYRNSKTTSEVEEETAISPIAKKSWLVVLAVTGFGLAGVVYGSEVLINGAVDLAKILGVSDTVIGLTIIAIGTSLPELATSIIASIRRQNDMALGNIVGSNIWNILFIIGTTTSIIDIKVPYQLVRYDIWVMMFITVLFLYFIGFQRKIDKQGGMLFVLVYILYIVSQILITKGILQV